MFKRSLLMLVSMALVLAIFPADNVQAKKKEDNDKAKDNGKSFEATIKDFEKIEGLFTFYVKEDEGEVLLEIKPDQFGKIYACNITRSAGDGNYYDNGADVGEFPFEFKRVGNKVQMLEKNLRFRALRLYSSNRYARPPNLSPEDESRPAPAPYHPSPQATH